MSKYVLVGCVAQLAAVLFCKTIFSGTQSEQLEFLNSQPYYASEKNCYPVVRFSGTPYRLVLSQKSTGWQNAGLSPANWPYPALGLQPTGDHYVGKPSTTGQPTRPTQSFILPRSIIEKQAR